MLVSHNLNLCSELIWGYVFYGKTVGPNARCSSHIAQATPLLYCSTLLGHARLCASPRTAVLHASVPLPLLCLQSNGLVLHPCFLISSSRLSRPARGRREALVRWASSFSSASEMTRLGGQRRGT